MISLLIAVSFMAMVLAPCVVAQFTMPGGEEDKF